MMNIKLYITVLDFEKHIIFFLHMGSVSVETGIKDRDMLYFGCDRKLIFLNTLTTYLADTLFT